MGNVLSHCFLDKYGKIYLLRERTREQTTQGKLEKTQGKHDERFHDAVDAISVLMFYPDQDFRQHDVPNYLMEIGTRKWNEYLMDGWMITEVGKMKKKTDAHRVVQLFRRCLNRRRYDLIRQLAQLNVSYYEAFLTAHGTKGEPEEDEYFIKDGHIGWSNTEALKSFADLSNATITIFSKPTRECPHGLRCNIFEHTCALKELLELLPFISNVKIADRSKLYDDFSNIALPDILDMINSPTRPEYKVKLVKFLLETFETINDYYMQTNHTVPSLKNLCMRYVHYKFVGPQASPLHRIISHAILEIPPSITWDFFSSSELCCNPDRYSKCFTREIVWKVYELCNDYKVDLNDLIILADHPDFKHTVSVDVFDNVLQHSQFYRVSTVEKQHIL